MPLNIFKELSITKYKLNIIRIPINPPAKGPSPHFCNSLIPSLISLF